MLLLRLRIYLLLLIPAVISSSSLAQPPPPSPKFSVHRFGRFNSSHYSTFAILGPATISNGALQVTPDSAGNFSLAVRSGRVILKQPYKLWEDSRTASFNTFFVFNIFRLSNSSHPGEGLAFLIAPDLNLPQDSEGEYLGLTNPASDGESSNQILAVEFDTLKQDFDPDDNHLGLDINSVRSSKTVSLGQHGIQLAPADARFYAVWIQYDGRRKSLEVYMAENGTGKPLRPILEAADLDLRRIVRQESFFGFAASVGTAIQLNSVISWDLTVEMLYNVDGSSSAVGGGTTWKVVVGVAAAVVSLLVVGVTAAVLWRRRRSESSEAESSLIGALKSLPGMPREIEFKDLKKATNNFDEELKLGEGGFGMVYKGILPEPEGNVPVPVAVKKFSRQNMKGQHDFLSELTIINRLRHKHLVRLLGWCHKNGMLLLVYDYMPNGSLDKHLFPGRRDGEKKLPTLQWDLRYKIIADVASALRYLHNEYDQKVVHRDLKASNIMLDSDFNARLGDFGLARALDNEKTSYAELGGFPGTMDYIAPECFLTGKATCESDIYGFGAVVLEVACGQRPWTRVGGFEFLVDWVWLLHREGRILEAVDANLVEGDFDAEQAQRLLLLGLACSLPIASQRPRIQAVCQILCGSMDPPTVPPFKPDFVWTSAGASERGGTTAYSCMSVEVTEVHAR